MVGKDYITLYKILQMQVAFEYYWYTYNLLRQIEIFFFLLMSTLKIGLVPYLSLIEQVIILYSVKLFIV